MNTEITAKLKGIKLSKDARQRIAVGLQQLVLSELAQIDNRGDLIVKRPVLLGPTNGISVVQRGENIDISSLP